MHSTIYEISDHPISTKISPKPGFLPDWFYESVCDYTTKMPEGELEHSIEQLTTYLGPHCTRNGDKLTFSPEFKQRYFKESFKYFKAAAKALSETEYDVFAGIKPAVAFDLALNGISESYSDKRAFYVYCSETEELSPLDTWLRKTDLSKPHYVHDAINYHY